MDSCCRLGVSLPSLLPPAQVPLGAKPKSGAAGMEMELTLLIPSENSTSIYSFCSRNLDSV